MGAGLAKQAVLKWPGIDAQLGHYLTEVGNIVCGLLKEGNCWVMSFPTKNNWKDKSNLELIKNSAQRLAEMADELEWKKVFIPPVGCGLGGLSLDVVQPVLEQYLDDRFYIINFN
jgi:hypothetical protein